MEDVLILSGRPAPEAVAPAGHPGSPAATRPAGLQRAGQVALATVWLLDAVLQLQPMMFTPGARGLSGMMAASAQGTPAPVASSIAWCAGIVAHHPVATNAAFAAIQFVIAFGILARRTLRAALALSIVWAVGVWWFGEGLGGVAQGAATPLGGGPGAALFYAVAAALLWPSPRVRAPFVAARAVGPRAARRIWVAMWGILAVLCLVGSGRTPGTLRGLVTGLQTGEPGWVVRVDHLSGSLLWDHGAVVAVALAAFCVVMAVSVYAPSPGRRAVLVAGAVVVTVMWVAVQDFGGILAGGATDPNSGPLLLLLVLLFWPLRTTPPSTVPCGS